MYSLDVSIKGLNKCDFAGNTSISVCFEES